MSVEGGPDIVTNGLVLYLDAANNRSIVSGSTTWFDLSRNGNTGSLINGPTYSSANGGSIVFDGANDYVACGNLTTLNNMSIGMWVKVLSNAGSYKAFAGAVGASNNDFDTGFNIDMQNGARSAFDRCSIE